VTALEEVGARALDMGIARDSEANVENVIDQAILQDADIIISTGGVSMGNKDFVKGILSRRGTVHFGKICMKPGKPCTFATIVQGGKTVLFFGLPGNPVSALTTFHLFVSPCIKVLQGIREDKLRIVAYACTTSDIKIDPSRTEFRRVNVQFQAETGKAGAGRLVAHDIMGSQASSRIMSYHGGTEQDCNALLVVPSVVETLGEPIIPAGSVLEAIMLEKKRILRHVV